VAVVQYTYTHKQYTERHKTNNTYNNTKIRKSADRAPSLRVLLWHLPKENSTDTIGNRSCDLPTCSAVPQSTAQPRVKIHFNITLQSTSSMSCLRFQLTGQNFICIEFLPMCARRPPYIISRIISPIISIDESEL